MYEGALSQAVQRHVAVSPVPGTLHRLYETWVLAPLARLYLYGPALGGWGFWNGLDVAVICSHKTHLLPEFWQAHPTECLQLIGQGFYGVLVLGETLVYFLGLAWVLRRVAAGGWTLLSKGCSRKVHG